MANWANQMMRSCNHIKVGLTRHLYVTKLPRYGGSMKILALAFLFLAPFASADTLYTVSAQTEPSYFFPYSTAVIGSYVLRGGQVVGPWWFQWDDGGVGGSGAGGPNGNLFGHATAVDDQGVISFDYAEGIPYYETENEGPWFWLTVDDGIVNGSITELVGHGGLGTEGFTGVSIDPSPIVTPEPSSLSLLSFGLLGLVGGKLIKLWLSSTPA